MPIARRLAVLACWLAAAIAYVAAILPQREAPHLGGSDKLDHMAAFVTITVLARIGYPRAGVVRLFLLATAFGAFIELSQALPIVHRDAELGDWLADTIAAIIGLAVAGPVLAWERRRRGEDA